MRVTCCLLLAITASASASVGRFSAFRIDTLLRARSFDSEGDGIVFPNSLEPLELGQTYVCTFLTGAQVQWGTLSLDLYMSAGTNYFISNVVKVDPSEVINPMNPLSGAIPFTAPASLGSGPLFFFRLYGFNNITQQQFYIPDSSYFSLMNPLSGTWNHPVNSDVWMRLELAGANLNQILNIVPNITITPSMTSGSPALLSLNVPVTLLTGQVWPSMLEVTDSERKAYFVRLVPNNGVYSSSLNTSVGAITRGFSLPSAQFTIFQSGALSAQQLSMTITLANTGSPISQTFQPVVFVGASVSLAWKWTGTAVGIAWNIDLYSTVTSSSIFTGKRLQTALSPTQYKWSVDQSIPSGLYFLRIWGYPAGTASTSTVDPVSTISGVFTIMNPISAPIINLKVLAANPWNLGCRANVTWSITQQNGGSVQGWAIDLYQNTCSFSAAIATQPTRVPVLINAHTPPSLADAPKFVTTLTALPLDPSSTWYIVDVPLTLPNSAASDYFVRVRAVLDQTLYPGQDIGNITTYFKILAAPPVAQRNATIANFKTAISAAAQQPDAQPATTVNYLSQPTSSASRNSAGLFSALYSFAHFLF
ncbi:hypothetical protein HDU83_008678 [Entophlyctis luteolus]|nr:hypothetical protein HDU83_008678 [Entophlyctis luteolus]